MPIMYKAKFRANGVTYYINTRTEEKRDRVVEFHRRAGLDVEVYQAECPAPETPVHAEAASEPAQEAGNVVDASLA